MTLGEIENTKGFEEVKAAFEKVLFRKNAYCFFSIGEIDPVSLVLASETAESPCAGNKTPTEADLAESWQAFYTTMKAKGDLPMYAVYDFGYYVNGDVFRSAIVLFSYIPDNQKGKVKMVYSTNVQSIKDSLHIPFLIQASEMGDISFDKLKELVTRVQITY